MSGIRKTQLPALKNFKAKVWGNFSLISLRANGTGTRERLLEREKSKYCIFFKRRNKTAIALLNRAACHKPVFCQAQHRGKQTVTLEYLRHMTLILLF